MLGRVIRAVEVPISLSVWAMGRGAAIAGRVAGWALGGVQRGLMTDRSHDRSPTEESVKDLGVAQPGAEGRPRSEEERPLAHKAGDGRGPAAETAEEREVAAAGSEPEVAPEPEREVRAEQVQESVPLSAQKQPFEGAEAAPAPEESPESGIVEHEPGAGTSVQARSPHSPLNNPVTEPDLTEWPDPYDHRDDPRDAGDDMVFGDDAGHTPTGSTSTSEPHPSHDPEAVPWEGPKRDKVDQ